MRNPALSPDSQDRLIPSSGVVTLLAWGVLAFAAAWALTSICVVLNFSLRYPAFDQFRLYPMYLGLPFPDSAIQLENGHRPVLPALVRLLEIEWLGANQMLQVGMGFVLVLATIVLIGLAGRKDGRSSLQGATVWLLAVLGLLWLGNARMLVHGNELVHAYLVTVFALATLWAVHSAARGHALRWMAMAGACALGAVFSFGSGMAAFAALFVTAFVSRVPWRAWIAPACLFALAMGLYMAGMPGDSGVRNALSFSPEDSAVVGLKWLSAPWVHAWLGYGDQSPFPWLYSAVTSDPLETGLRGSATVVHALMGEHRHLIEAIIIGGFGVSAWLACLAHAWRHGAYLGRGRLVALGLATFGLAVGATICLFRLRHFHQNPNDVLAERYLPWSCLFWLGLALYALAATRMRSRRGDVIAAAMAVMLAFCLIPSQRWWAGWAAAVHRSNQISSVAAQMGIWDPERFPDGPDAPKADVLHTLELMRARHLSMFGEAGYAIWTSGELRPPWSLARSEALDVRRKPGFMDESGRLVTRVEGAMPTSVSLSRSSVLVMVDASGQLKGMAKASFIGYDQRALRFDLPGFHGFDGYLLDLPPDEAFDLFVIDPDTRTAIMRFAVSH